jgi:hypothetical protein
MLTDRWRHYCRITQLLTERLVVALAGLIEQPW